MKYFISYTTRDMEITKSLLQEVSNKLNIFGQVFVDLIDNRSSDKQARVLAELDSSDLIILIESKNVYQSDWVLLELDRAKKNNIPIRTLTINDVSNFDASMLSGT